MLLVASLLAFPSGCIPDLPGLPTDAGPGPLAHDSGQEAAPAQDAAADAEDAPAPSTCGDGVIDLANGEQCDPGPTAVTGCSSGCKVSCAAGFIDPTTSHCYFVLGAADSPTSANNKCSASGGAHLVTFVSDAEWQFVSKKASDAGAPVFWVGLQYDSTAKGYLASNEDEPGWEPLSSCPGCYAFQNASLGGGFPKTTVADAGTSTGTCVIATTGDAGGWFEWACGGGTNFPTVCEREPPGSYASACDGGSCISIPATYPGKQYLYVAASDTAANAAATCRGTLSGSGTPGQLVVLTSREEREQLWSALANPQGNVAPDRFWIGLSSSGDAGADASPSWAWGDGTPADGAKYPPLWAANQPASIGAGQATVQINDFTYDKQLAHASSPQSTVPFVCQF